MSAQSLEAFLARLFTEASFRRDFLAEPARVASEAGLDPTEIPAVLAMDRGDLHLAAESYRRKRAGRTTSGGWMQALRARWR